MDIFLETTLLKFKDLENLTISDIFNAYYYYNQTYEHYLYLH